MDNQKQGIIDSIIDKGVVTSVSRNSLTVKLQPDSTCGSCPAAALCGKGDAGTNTMEIKTPDASAYHEGQQVEVEITETLHRKAIRVATIYPTIAIIAVMTGVYLLSGSQAAAACCGIGTMIFFFVILYLFRNKLQHEFNFRVIQ